MSQPLQKEKISARRLLAKTNHILPSRSCPAYLRRALNWAGFFSGFWQCLNMPEKTLNDLPRDLRLLFQRGQEAIQRDNFDYAIEMFTQILAREPSVFEVRKTLRATQATKSGKS